MVGMRVVVVGLESVRNGDMMKEVADGLGSSTGYVSRLRQWRIG